MNGSKPWYQSRGVLGALIVVLCSCVQLYHAIGSPNDPGPQLTGPQSSMVDTAIQFATLAGGALALIGRVGAKQNISTTSDDSKSAPAWMAGACLLTMLTLGACATNQADLPQRQATRGDNFNTGVTVNVNLLSNGKSPSAATPGLAGTPQGVGETNAAVAANEKPSPWGADVTVGAVTSTVTVSANPTGGGTLTASTAGGSSGPQTATPSTTVTPNLNLNLPASGP